MVLSSLGKLQAFFLGGVGLFFNEGHEDPMIDYSIQADWVAIENGRCDKGMTEKQIEARILPFCLKYNIYSIYINIIHYVSKYHYSKCKPKQ